MRKSLAILFLALHSAGCNTPRCLTSPPSSHPFCGVGHRQDQNSAAFPHIFGSDGHEEPTAIVDGPYRMWYCSRVPSEPQGIYYAESPSVFNQPRWTSQSGDQTWRPVFRPTGNTGDFDGAEVCDPSVIRIDGVYFMYYSGRGYSKDVPPVEYPHAIGLAISKDGKTWRRLNGGKPIVAPAGEASLRKNPFGAGRPSVSYLDGWFYLLYGDTSGFASRLKTNNTGVYALRSRDPMFPPAETQELYAEGWGRFDPKKHTTFSPFPDFTTVDLAYSDAAEAWVVIGRPTRDVEPRFMSVDLRTHLHLGNVVGSPLDDGASIVTRPDRHLPPAKEGCWLLLPSFLFVNRTIPEPSERVDRRGIGSFYEIFTSPEECSCGWMRARRLYEGSIVSSPKNPPALLREGRLITPERPQMLDYFARNKFMVTDSVYGQLGTGIHIGPTARATCAFGKPWTLHAGPYRFPVTCLDAVEAAGAKLEWTCPEGWDGDEAGPALHCLDQPPF
jgi:hypothetical protein